MSFCFEGFQLQNVIMFSRWKESYIFQLWRFIEDTERFDGTLQQCTIEHRDGTSNYVTKVRTSCFVSKFLKEI